MDFRPKYFSLVLIYFVFLISSILFQPNHILAKTKANEVWGVKELCSSLGGKEKYLHHDIDLYTFSGEKGEKVILTLEANPSGSSVGEGATLILTSRFKHFLKIDRGPLPNKISATLPARGEYFVYVIEKFRSKGVKSFKGDYCLTLKSSKEAWKTFRPFHLSDWRKHPITWIPDKIEETVSKGTVAEMMVAFISTSDLKKVNLWTTPELRPFLRLEPDYFENIEANTTYEVKLLLTVPKEVKAGHYEGTIHLRGGNRTYPETLKVDLNITENLLPVANAGPNQFVLLPAGQSKIDVQLDGSGSYDLDGTIVSYTWTGSPDPEDVAKPIVSLKQGVYNFTLQVLDDKGGSSAANTQVTVLGTPLLMPLPQVTNGQTITIKGISVPGATISLINTNTGESQEILNEKGLFEVPFTLAPGLNEFQVTAKIGNLQSNPVLLKTTYAVRKTLQLDMITPDRGQSGSIITLTGSGFTPDPKVMGVHFIGSEMEGTGLKLESKGVVLEASETQLKVVVPFIFLKSDEDVEVYAYDGQNMSNSIMFHVVNALDPTPETKGNEVDYQLHLLLIQIQNVFNKLEQWTKPHVPPETWARLEENMRRTQYFLETIQNRVRSIPSEDVQSRLDAIFGSEFFGQFAEILEEVNERLNHTTSCDVAEVIEILRDILEPIDVINDILDDTLNALSFLILGDTVACFFGCTPCCGIIAFLYDVYSSISAIDRVIDSIRNVLNTVIDMMLAGIPTIPSEWKVDIKGPFPGISNHILYTNTTNTLRLYANFTNAGFERLLNHINLKIDIPDPFGIFALLGNFGIYIENLIEEALGDLLLDLAVDLLDIDEIRITFADINIDSRVTEHADTSNLIFLPDEGASRMAHTINVYALPEGKLYPEGIQLDIQASCGQYYFPTRTKCNHLAGNVCTSWGTDYPRYFDIKVIDKPLYTSFPSLSSKEECREVSFCYDWKEGKHLCSMDEYRNAIKQICLHSGKSETYCNEEICYDENTGSYDPMCNQDLYYATLDLYCADNMQYCEQVVPTKNVCREYGMWIFEGQGFSTYTILDPYCADIHYNSCYDNKRQEFLCTEEQYRTFFQEICQGFESMSYCQNALSCYCADCSYPSCSLQQFQERLDAVCENLPDRCSQYISFTKRECNNGPFFKIYWNGEYYSDLLASYKTDSFNLYYDLKPGMVSVGISDVIGNERRSAEWFVLPNIRAHIKFLNPDIYPGETLYVSGNFFSTRLGNEQLFLYAPHQTYTLFPDAHSSVGLYTREDLLLFKDIPEIGNHKGGRLNARLKVFNFLSCSENNCAEDSINILPYEKVGKESIDDQDVVIHGGVGTYMVRTVAIGDLNGDGKNDLVIGVTDYQDPSSGRAVGAIFIKFGPIAGIYKEMGEKTVQSIDLSSEDGGWDVMIIGDPNAIHQDGNTRRIGNSIAIGDLDNDGIADLIIGSTDQNELGEHRPNIEWAYGGAPGHVPGSVYIFYGKREWQRKYALGEGEYDHKLYADDHREFGYQVAVGRITTRCFFDIGDFNLICPSGLDLVITAPAEIVEEIYAYDKVSMAYHVRGFNNSLPKDIKIPDDLPRFSSYTLIYGSSDRQRDVRVLEDGKLHFFEYTGDGMGKAVAIGDKNGDGYEDLVLGAPQYSQMIGYSPLVMQRGVVYVLYGGNDFGGTDHQIFMEVENPYRRHQDLYILGPRAGRDITGFGSSLLVADLDNDGKGEIVIGAPYSPLNLKIYADTTIPDNEQGKFDTSSSPAVGAIYIFDGAKALNFMGLQADRQSDLTVHGSFVMTKFGYSLAKGDINNDGIMDLLVGAPGREDSNAPGRVWVLYGSNEAIWKNTANKLDTMHLENRRWYITSEGSPFDPMNPNIKIPSGVDYVFIGDMDNKESIGLGFGISVAVGDLSPYTRNDVVIVDRFGKGPNQDSINPGPGAAYIFFKYGLNKDLKINSLSIGSIDGEVYPSSSVNVTFAVANQGSGQVEPFEIGFYLSNDNIIDAGDIFLGALNMDGVPGNGENQGSGTLLIPPNLSPGFYFIIGYADHHNQVLEFDEGNNLYLQPLTVINPSNIVVKPGTLDFGQIVVGRGRDRNLEIKNEVPGSGAKLKISGISYSGDGVFQLDITNYPTPSNPWVLENNQSISFPIYFMPQSVGSFSGTITIISNDPDEGEIRIPVIGTAIEGAPEIQVTAMLSFNDSNLQKSLLIENRGNKTLTWTIVPDWYQNIPWPSWLTVTPLSGQTEPRSSSSVNVSVTHQGLTAGTYVYNIYIQSNDPNRSNLPVLIVFTTQGQSAPVISVSPTRIDFGETGTNASFTISNTGGGTLTWSINNNLPNWLQVVSAMSGETAAGETSSVILNVSRNLMIVGNYSHTLTITSNGGSANVQITMTVPGQALFVSPNSLDFGTTLTEGNFTIQNKGTFLLQWSIPTTFFPPWLRVMPTSGNLSPTFSTNVSVYVDRNRGRPAPGSYQYTIDIGSNGGSASVVISMVVPEPALSVSPRSLDFGRTTNENSLIISNIGGGTLNWNITNDLPNWLSVSSMSGETLAGVPAEVILKVNREGLSSGTYNHTLSINSNGGSADVSISMRVELVLPFTVPYYSCLETYGQKSYVDADGYAKNTQESLNNGEGTTATLLASGYRGWCYPDELACSCDFPAPFNFPGVHPLYLEGSSCSSNYTGWMSTWGSMVADPQAGSMTSLVGGLNKDGPIKTCYQLGGRIYCYLTPPDTWGYGYGYGYLRQVMRVESYGTLPTGAPVEIRANISMEGVFDGADNSSVEALVILNKVENADWLQNGNNCLSWSYVQEGFSNLFPGMLGYMQLRADSTTTVDQNNDGLKDFNLEDSITANVHVGDIVVVETFLRSELSLVNPGGSGEKEGWAGQAPNELIVDPSNVTEERVKAYVEQYGNHVQTTLTTSTPGAILVPYTNSP